MPNNMKELFVLLISLMIVFIAIIYIDKCGIKLIMKSVIFVAKRCCCILTENDEIHMCYEIRIGKSEYYIAIDSGYITPKELKRKIIENICDVTNKSALDNFEYRVIDNNTKIKKKITSEKDGSFWAYTADMMHSHHGKIVIKNNRAYGVKLYNDSETELDIESIFDFWVQI